MSRNVIIDADELKEIDEALEEFKGKVKKLDDFDGKIPEFLINIFDHGWEYKKVYIMRDSKEAIEFIKEFIEPLELKNMKQKKEIEELEAKLPKKKKRFWEI